MISPARKFFFATVLIMAAVGYLVSSNLSESLVYYYTVEEFQARQDGPQLHGIRVSGKATDIEVRGERCRFRLLGEEQSLAVIYQGLLPDTFKEGAEVVAEGRWDPAQEHFDATTILAKCPSKYEAEEYEHGHPGESGSE
jgi:cytochrome c-type biogenesis protein CcmE